MFKKFALVTAFAAALSLPQASQACGWSEDWESSFYRFFDPDYEQLAEYKPFNFTFDRLYDYELLDEKTSAEPNIKDWQKYLGPNFPAEDIKAIVYDLNMDEMLDLRKGIQRKQVPANFQKNTLVKDWLAGKRLDLLNYLALAHEAAAFSAVYDPWGEESPEMEAVPIIEAAREGYQATSDKFLRLRYGYQALRVAQYEGQHADGIAYYEEMVKPNIGASKLIGDWATSNYAGCKRELGQEAEAAYLFTKVFMDCPSRRIQAWYSWRILSDDIWEQAQSYCQNNREMSGLYFLRCFGMDEISYEDLRQIHELDPGSKLLDVLLSREINKIEVESLGYPFSGRESLGKRIIKNAGRADELSNIVAEVIASGKMNDKSLWFLADAYLEYLGGDLKAAMFKLDGYKPQLSAEGQLKARSLDLVFKIAGAQHVDKSVENDILKDYTNLSRYLSEENRDEMEKFRDEALAYLYEKQGEDGKALIARRNHYLLMENTSDVALVNAVLAFEAKEDKTLYEKQLMERLHSSFNHDQILEIKGTKLLAKNLVPEAIAVFKQLPESYRKSSNTFSLNADPFISQMTDVINCEDCGVGKYNKLSYAEAVVALQRKALEDPAKAVDYYLLLGNAAYNTTYFGPAWNATDYYRSGGSWYYLGEESDWYKFDMNNFDENVDCSLAADYYRKAMTASKDKEKTALAAFMLGKCELNHSYCFPRLEASYDGFSVLAKYYKTDICRKAINECWYFNAYANSK